MVDGRGELDYKNLNIWNISLDLVEDVYRLVGSFPKSEMYALTDQLKRAVVFISSNIAEGANRNTNKEFIQFFYIALGSASEVETQLIIAKRLGYCTDIDQEIARLTSIRKMLNALNASIKRKDKGTP